VVTTPVRGANEALTDLRTHDARISHHRVTNKVRFIGAKTPIAFPGVTTTSPRAAAGMAAVKRYGALFGLTEYAQEIRTIRDVVKPGRGSRHRYRQVFRGVPVLAGELLVNLDESRRLVSMTGEISPGLSLSIRPGLTAGQARKVALEAVAKWYGITRTELKASAPELWIVDPRLIVPDDRPPILAWRLEVIDKGSVSWVRELVFVDAQNGGIAVHVNLIGTTRNRKTYDAGGGSVLPGSLVCDETDPTCAAGDADAAAAHIYAGDTYDFYLDEHGRDSLDDAGQTLVSTVHWDNWFICPNAFWNGTQMVYCDGFSMADDVVGHELTHGITAATSNLFYYYQSGAINESLSDVWGEFVDLTNQRGDDGAAVRWKLGEDLPFFGAIRDMANPPAFNDPDRVGSVFYHTGSDDNGGVHTNSGVNNKAAYLMTDGGTFNGHTVWGLGIGKVADIYYEAQTNLLVSGSDYADLYQALNQACQNLVGVDGITQSDCDEVRNATEAVEMNSDPANFNPDAEICPPGEEVSDLFLDDIENGSVMWVLTNLSGATTTAWIPDTGYTTSGEFMLWGRDRFINTDAVAELNVDVVLPVDETAYLHFRHAFGFEAPYFSTFYDGGWIEYSTDGGTTWYDAGPLIDDGQDYTGSLASNNPNPSHPAFVAESHGYVSTRLDLSSLSGQNVRFRWRISTDESVSGPFGWVVDDVRFYICGSSRPPNQPPQILSISATPSTISDTETIALSATVTDPDGPLLPTYSWGVDPGEGTIIDATSPDATYLPPNVSSQEVFTVTVDVDDGLDVTSATVEVTVQDAGGDVPLIVSRPDDGAYGNNYGSDQNETLLTVVFEGAGTDLQLSVTGFDIDSVEEVGVYLNGTLVGYLRVGPDGDLNVGNTFVILASQQVLGTNVVEFRQMTVGETWGITDLLLENFLPDVRLTIGFQDGGEYGHNFGSGQHDVSLFATFTGSSGDLTFSLTGYDIDYTDEVAVILNGGLLGYLSTGSNDGLNGGDEFLIQAGQQSPGTNVIEIRQRTPGFRWGVTDLLIDYFQPDVTLTVDVLDSGEYGNKYGSDQNETLMMAAFQSTGSDLRLSVTGYDIDFPDEVAVLLNREFLGYLTVGSNNGFNGGNVFIFPAWRQVPGTNVVEFRQRTAYGNNYGSDQNDTALVATFQSTGTDLELSLRGYDIDDTHEVAVHLNGSLRGYLSRGPDNGLNGGDTFLVPASQQFTGTNLIEIRQKSAGETWGVTDLLLDYFHPDTTLQIGVPDGGAYGKNYGSDQNETLLRAAFQSSGADLELSVTGFDIDSADELTVYLNGTFLGHVRVGQDDSLNAGDIFLVPASLQFPATNVIEILQKSAGETWGVTNLLLDNFQPDTTLQIGVPDGGAYGKNYGGNQNETLLRAAFQNTGADLELSVTGFDIDSADEVAVHLNANLVGYLSTGPNDGLNGGDTFLVKAVQQFNGTNVIEFRQKTPGYKWGVTNLLLKNFQPDVTLTIGVQDSGEYGHNYGSNQHETLLTAAFQSTGSPLRLSVTGFDIDFPDEVAVILNREFLGYLTVGSNNGFNGGNVIVLPAAQQSNGTNVIEFRQKTVGFKWGVTNLLLEDFQSDMMLAVGLQDSGAYGNNYGSDEHETVIAATFQSPGTDLRLSVRGYDIDDGDEVAVHLNGSLLGYLGVGPDNGLSAVDTVLVPASQQFTGTNLLEFRQKTAGETWGITNTLLHHITLVTGTPDGGEYGHNFGTDQNDVSLFAVFNGSEMDLELSVTGYDVDFTDEVAVFLNGDLLGHLSTGSNDALNAGDTFLIQAAEQHPGMNVIEIQQRTPGFKWGVTNLLLMNFQPDVTLTIGFQDSGEYGHNFGSNQHETVLTAAFQSSGTDLRLTVTGFDIDFADEVAVYLNWRLLGYLVVGSNNGFNVGDLFVLPASQQFSGTNAIEFRQRTPGYKWGVTNLLLSND
jgi:Zn-dependent metalloprotease